MGSRQHAGVLCARTQSDGVRMQRGPSKTRAVIEGLVEDLGGSDPQRVEEARETLVSMGSRPIRSLIRALDSEDDRLRVQAIALLGLLGSAEAGPAVSAQLHDDSSSVRRAAALALARLEANHAIPSLEALLRREERTRVRVAAVQALVRKLQTGHETALRAILSRLADPDEEESVRLAAMNAVPWIASPSDVPAANALLTELTHSGQREVAARARRMLEDPPRTRLEPWAMEKLIVKLGSARHVTWSRAVSLLGRAGGAVTEPLVQAMLARSDEPAFARRCVLVLSELSPRQLERLGPYLDLLDEPVVLEALIDVIEAVEGRALLARLGSLIQRLAKGSEAKGPGPCARVRIRAHEALARAGSRLAAADLRDLLEDERFPVDVDLVRCAGLIGTRLEIPSLLAAHARSKGLARLAVRETITEVALRERLRRNDRLIGRLPKAQRDTLLEMLVAPKKKTGRKALGSARRRPHDEDATR